MPKLTDSLQRSSVMATIVSNHVLYLLIKIPKKFYICYNILFVELGREGREVLRYCLSFSFDIYSYDGIL